jgi:glycine/D-amino acid oxidase-like deaminating enzyme
VNGAAWVEAEPRPFWLDSPLAPAPSEPFAGEGSCSLAVIGGGFTGLWAALQAKQDDPGRDVLVLEAATVAAGASGRNGGFTDASLTHGLPNGLSRFPGEIDQLKRLGRENLDGIAQTIELHGIDCGWERTGSILVARNQHEVDELSEFVPVMREKLLFRGILMQLPQLAETLIILLLTIVP